MESTPTSNYFESSPNYSFDMTKNPPRLNHRLVDFNREHTYLDSLTYVDS